MKRKALIKDLAKAGCFLKRHGSRHDIYANPRNGRQTPHSKTFRDKKLTGSTNQKATRNMNRSPKQIMTSHNMAVSFILAALFCLSSGLVFLRG